MFDGLCFGYHDIIEKLSYPNKSEFRLNAVVTGLNLSESIIKQNDVILKYRHDGKIISVPAKHGIVTLFKIDGDYYALGLPTENPLGDKPIQLKASIGGMHEASINVSISQSLENEIALETNHILSLSKFDIASQYVCHREPDWDEWSVCFIKIAALSKVIFTLEQLKEMVTLMNKTASSPYGIYKLDAIIQAAKKTAGLPEGSLYKHKTRMMNYHNNQSEDFVIFDNNAIAKLFEDLTVEHLFAPNRKLARL